MLQSYNHSKHQSIGIAPANVRKNNENEIWDRLYRDGDTIRKRSERVHDQTMVRVNKWKDTFEKGYMRNWSHENFKVTGHTADLKEPVYKLRMKWERRSKVFNILRKFNRSQQTSI